MKKFKYSIITTIFSVLLLSILPNLFNACADGSHNPIEYGTSKNSIADGGIASTGPFYNTEIQTIFKQECSQCHNSVSSVPDWMDYPTAYAKRLMIYNRVVTLKDMPMGRTMADELRNKIAAWVDAGAPYQASTDGTTGTPITTQPSDPGTTTPPTDTTTGGGTQTNPLPTNLDLSSPLPIPADGTVTYYDQARPLFKQYCSACHNSVSSVPNWLDFTTAFTKRSLIYQRAFITQDMPKGISMPQADRQIIATWVDQGGICGADPQYCGGSTTTGGTTTGGSTTGSGSSTTPTVMSFKTPNVWNTFNTKCAYCHTSTASKLPSIMNYDQAMKFSDKILRFVWTDKTMPTPGSVDITDTERSYLAQWVQDGALFSADPNETITPNFEPNYYTSAVKYSVDLKPIFQSKCISCHSSSSSLIKLGDYGNTTNLSSQLSNLVSSGLASSHKNSNLTSDEISKISSWLNNGKFY